ncbi:hypothetical protein LNTAR_10151 [Lentisphaera araneosa HTCC2155]|uniref:Uncharacterized protein n=1 Tax=Lentisphaera araneosa HTCC2155 TaxID=313628 RepID=A6DII3_9BACT|nr:hypothetical protein [Lentisphaera araneosa]EDM28269.1 hypothetical protein LNTAR_10151 [Lentisphaera araneosa HTCC2155]
MKKNNPNEFFIVCISRTEIESSSTRRIIKLFKDMTYNHAKRFMNKVELTVSGYDNDPRELCEVQDVRDFMAKLKVEFNSFFFLLNFHTLSQQFVMFSTCDCDSQDGKIFISEEEIVRYMLDQFNELNMLEFEGVITPEDNQLISGLAGDYFSNPPHLF